MEHKFSAHRINPKDENDFRVIHSESINELVKHYITDLENLKDKLKLGELSLEQLKTIQKSVSEVILLKEEKLKQEMLKMCPPIPDTKGGAIKKYLQEAGFNLKPGAINALLPVHTKYINKIMKRGY
jgi:hypothetical protein